MWGIKTLFVRILRTELGGMTPQPVKNVKKMKTTSFDSFFQLHVQGASYLRREGLAPWNREPRTN